MTPTRNASDHYNSQGKYVNIMIPQADISICVKNFFAL